MGLRYGHFRALELLLISCLILSAAFVRGDEASDDDLVKLARKQKELKYDAMSKVERSAFDEFFLRVDQGAPADFRRKNSTAADYLKGDSWGSERTVKGEWIVWLCKDARSEQKLNQLPKKTSLVLDASESRAS